jgi:O-6-methylguanine DNA methyltransferase
MKFLDEYRDAESARIEKLTSGRGTNVAPPNTGLQGSVGHTCALTESGAPYCWGWNGDGQLGDGTTVDRLAPVAVKGGLTLTMIGAGGQQGSGDAARRLGVPSASRAVGAAVGSNPVSIIVPCHRVVGSTGSLTGYAGGLARKTSLLHIEAERLARGGRGVRQLELH